MDLAEIQQAIDDNNIDKLISSVKYINKNIISEAIAKYEEYYSHEVAIAKELQNILTQVKIRRVRKKIPITGNYTYKLE